MPPSPNLGAVAAREAGVPSSPPMEPRLVKLADDNRRQQRRASSSCTQLAARGRGRGRAPASVSSPREVRRRSGVRADVRSLVNRHESCCVGVAKANIRRLAKRKPSAIGANIAWTRMNPQGARRSECADLVTFEGPLVAVRTEPLEGSISHSALVIFFHEQDWMDYYQG